MEVLPGFCLDEAVASEASETTDLVTLYSVLQPPTSHDRELLAFAGGGGDETSGGTEEKSDPLETPPALSVCP